MGIFDWKHWIVILIVVVLVFGTKKLKNLGTDVGESIKGFRKAMSDEEKNEEKRQEGVSPQASSPHTIDGQHHKVEEPVRKD
ncbi:twin-arginine translocase TatA/TatE family subunit [Pseudomonas typographi]|uniref:Sec-independent protein translocase protein TatA n=1 Tax=Pseudomonas typographi TaxID=2715964 RepID=A0ABR7Z5U7_9PSED|nr:twin-arginine translocase TatA/TatE family subunit [Pseudomonas typographi]MBD1551853.1 twin-arginine translocase TatA/TatE family subunit [Pseudomonas typographi]MBD1587658.1 twin-arginine translocase TatA/TatE family subunit [Pseudomonas typographi]MBD1600840.1 twin-arginine translocase TatA/TatE family subunit [Pseudomonas typographi]